MDPIRLQYYLPRLHQIQYPHPHPYLRTPRQIAHLSRNRMRPSYLFSDRWAGADCQGWNQGSMRPVLQCPTNCPMFLKFPIIQEKPERRHLVQSGLEIQDWKPVPLEQLPVRIPIPVRLRIPEVHLQDYLALLELQYCQDRHVIRIRLDSLLIG